MDKLSSMCHDTTLLRYHLSSGSEYIHKYIYTYTHTLSRNDPPSLPLVTTRPYDARRDAPLSRRQTRHNERSSETEGNALRSLFYYLSNLEPATLGISTSAKALSCFPPIIGNLNIATISHLASL